ncbi:MAG: hypothetical protein L0Y57_15695 [Beijerinckiaceae bacterium]|nr:hypothetical protein [Beijerinckiaceae bacterium]
MIPITPSELRIRSHTAKALWRVSRRAFSAEFPLYDLAGASSKFAAVQLPVIRARTLRENKHIEVLKEFPLPQESGIFSMPVFIWTNYMKLCGGVR